MYTICPRDFFRWKKVFPGKRSPLLSHGYGHQIIRYAEITLQARLVGYMCMYSEIFLVRFLLDILKSYLVGLDNSAWEFD